MTEFRPSRFEILPLVIKNLLIICGLIYLAQFTFSGKGNTFLLDWFALHHVKSPLFKPWQLITHMFLHGDFWHLFGNMFALWMFGSVLESLWGPKRFLTFFFLCGIGAAAIHLGFLWYEYQGLLKDFMIIKLQPSSDNIISFYQKYGLAQHSDGAFYLNQFLSDTNNSTYLNQAAKFIAEITNKVVSEPTIGASGAVFGVLAAFVYLFPNTYIYLYFFVPVKAKYLIILYGAYELYFAFKNSSGDNVAHWAHIGGALVGIILVINWNKKNKKTFY